jgi:hypothetical protein
VKNAFTKLLMLRIPSCQLPINNPCDVAILNNNIGWPEIGMCEDNIFFMGSEQAYHEWRACPVYLEQYASARVVLKSSSGEKGPVLILLPHLALDMRTG